MFALSNFCRTLCTPSELFYLFIAFPNDLKKGTWAVFIAAMRRGFEPEIRGNDLFPSKIKTQLELESRLEHGTTLHNLQ